MKTCKHCFNEITVEDEKRYEGFCKKCYIENKQNKLPIKPKFSKGLIIYCVIAFTLLSFIFLVGQVEPEFGMFFFEILIFVLVPLGCYYFGSYQKKASDYDLAINDYKSYEEKKDKESLELIRKYQENKANEIDYTIIVANDSKKSLGSSVVRGAVGGALLGTVGLVGGALSGKNKSKTTFTVVYKSGQREVVAVDNDSDEFKKYAEYLR